ncbi:MAG: TRAP transporter large permease subunit, partial [Spirochaetales bacterium]
TISIILLTMPLVAPVLATLEIDPIWYGIILTVNLTLALVTPPVGMDLYVISGLQKDVHISEVIQGVLPFIILMIGVLILVIAFPPLSTWLPSIMK